MITTLEWLTSWYGLLIMSVSDMLLLFYLCGGNGETLRRHKRWGWCFAGFFVASVVTHWITRPPLPFILFYTVHFLVLLVYSAKCSDAPSGARFYLTSLSLLANDMCLILFVGLSTDLFGVDYVDFGPWPLRLAAHMLLLVFKFGVTVLIRKQALKQIYGIESAFQAFIIMLPALPYFFIRDYGAWFGINPFEVPVTIHYLGILCGVCALVNMIVSEKLTWHIRQNELLRMDNLVKQQHNHYLSSARTVEAVNRKYHDLRYILRAVNSMENVEEIRSFISAFEGGLKEYELICNTGNRTLDIILSERIHEAHKRHIQLHAHADGQGWEVVRDVDIATIFGNALDNAFENAARSDDDSNRLIEVRTGRMNEMLIARFENRFTHALEKRQSKLRTTKKDRQNHGYGLQSIEMVVSKYGGEVDISTAGGVFVLTVIIPVPQKREVC